ncbi:MAG: LytTR family DNA-binding domain-containing protein [Bacteroidota bacterium]
MKAIIVDDEPKAIELLESYIQHFGMIQLIATFRNGLKAMEFLGHTAVDLVFLDINMPHLNGISLSKLLPSETKVIFTTAYSEYAVESYEVNAVDYLLKPISLERFSKSITKLVGQTFSTTSNQSTSSKIDIRSGVKTFRVNAEEINYLEKDGNYMVYYLEGKKLLSRQTVAEALKVLPDYFVRVHRSLLVNIRKVEFYSGNTIGLAGKELTLSAQYREEFQKALSK